VDVDEGQVTDVDRIRLTGVRARGHHGVNPEERRDGQLFVVDAELSLDLSRAAASDDLSLTVDYATVASAIVSEIVGPPCDLIETVATRVAERVLADPSVVEVTVTVHKPHAPVGVPLDDVAVVVTRRHT
jgi:dihydroneopterin aldolase/2-amino-4-hydroxy-6-hydroxymethyldihydropteridine diphosphokinase